MEEEDIDVKDVLCGDDDDEEADADAERRAAHPSQQQSPRSKSVGATSKAASLATAEESLCRDVDRAVREVKHLGLLSAIYERYTPRRLVARSENTHRHRHRREAKCPSVNAVGDDGPAKTHL